MLIWISLEFKQQKKSQLCLIQRERKSAIVDAEIEKKYKVNIFFSVLTFVHFILLFELIVAKLKKVSFNFLRNTLKLTFLE